MSVIVSAEEWDAYVEKVVAHPKCVGNLVKDGKDHSQSFREWMRKRMIIGKSWDATSWIHWYWVWDKLSNDKTKDDHIIVVTGNPGMGKTSMMQLIGATVCLARSRLDCFVYTGVDLTNLVDRSEPGDPAYVDEGGRLLLNTEGQTKDQSEVVKTFMQMRFKRNLVIICIPSIWKLNKYVRDERVNEVVWIWYKDEKKFRNDARVFNLMKQNETARLVMIREMQRSSKVNLMKLNVPRSLFYDCRYKPVWPIFSEAEYESDKKQKDWEAHVRSINERKNGSPGVEKLFYSISEVCNILSVGRMTVTRWINSGKVEATKTGSVWRVKKESIDSIMNNKDNITSKPKLHDGIGVSIL